MLHGRRNFSRRYPRRIGTVGRRLRATCPPSPFAAAVGGLAGRRFRQSTRRLRVRQDRRSKREEVDAIEIAWDGNG